MELSTISYKGLNNCLKISNGTVDLVITTDIGPRVLFYGFSGGQDFFANFDDQLSNIKPNEWQNYGGHRLWHSPEIAPRTYYPDNEKVEYDWDGKVLKLRPPAEKVNQVEKLIEIELAETGTSVKLNHTIFNRAPWDIELSVWCLSVMAPGGKAYVPQEEFRPHPDHFLPARPLVLWHFTNMRDPRFDWNEKYIGLSQDDKQKTKQKFGVLNTKGWAAYLLNGEVFLKGYDCIEGAAYPDHGCNSEFFTMPDFLEIETLSPLTKIEPDGRLDHWETWSLHKMDDTSSDDAVFLKLEELTGQ